MNHILAAIESLPAFTELKDQIGQTANLIRLALLRSARPPVLAALHQATNRPILLITQKTDRALALAEELSIWLPDQNRLFFPEPTSLFFEKQTWGENTIIERLNTLTALATSQIPGQPKPDTAPIVIAPARSIMSVTLPKRDFLKASRSYKTGGEINLTSAINNWVKIGYEPASTVTAPGQFARRGGIIDIWPPTEPHPVRLELFGDEIDSIRQFIPGSQRTENRLNKILVGPAREFIKPENSSDDEENTTFTEFHIPILHPGSATLLDYLPKDSLVIFDNWQAFEEIVEYFEEHALNLKAEYLVEGILTADHPDPYITLPEVLDSIGDRTVLHLGPSSSETDNDLAYSFSTNPRFGGQLKPFLEFLDNILLEPEDTVVVSRQAARLKDVWGENHTGTSPTFIQGIITDGFCISRPDQPDIRLLTDGEIFGWRRPQPRRPQRPQIHAPEADFADFEANDLVVHIDHGIGYFKGFVSREIGGVQNEYLCLEYSGGDELYVPIHQSDRISRYVGSRGHRPSISRLSGPEWKRVKSKVQKAVEAVAQDLLELYAKRHVSKGFAFPEDTSWQKELEASFPYIETEDQLKVLEDVKQDMESPTPMDRLICGDVGYGKTEIALRAALKP